MIYQLHEAERLGPSRGGSIVRDLSRLASSGVDIVPTVLVPTTSFQEWQQHSAVNEADINQLLNWTRSQSPRPEQLFIRSSIPELYHGLADKIIVEANFTAIRAAIERIYRSWGDERTRASRLILQVDEVASIPVVAIQPLTAPIYSVITRHSVSGTLTTSSDYPENVNNDLPAFSQSVDRLIGRCDEVLGRPVKIHFTGDESLQRLTVLCVSDEIMTPDGFARALMDLLRKSTIDEIQFLRRLTPSMIAIASPPTAEASIHIKGLPVSPGIARGHIVFRGSPFGRENTQAALIFICDDMFPEDIHLLSKSKGAVGVRGGHTSHLAVVSRGMGLPAVTSCGGQVNLSTRTYKTETGEVINEDDEAVVDGSSGLVLFGDISVKQGWIRNDEYASLASAIKLCLDHIQMDQFKKLSVDAQWHIAALKNRLREVEQS